MDVTFSIDEHLLASARQAADALGKTLDGLIRDYLANLVADDADRWIEEFKRTSGQGHSNGWRFNREEIHQRR